MECFPSPRAALYAGFRPCLRCYPMGCGQQPPALVDKLIRAVEKDPGERLLEQELLGHLQIDLIKARRQFHAYTGMTFPAYHRARRMGLALLQVRIWNNAITQIGIGPKLTSDSRKAFTKTFDSMPVTAKSRNYFFSRWIDTPIGPMLAIANSEGLALLEFVDRRGLENEIKRLCYRHKCTIVPGSNPHLEQVNEELQRYFSGKSLIFSVPLSFTGSDFQRRTWQLLLQTPAGETRSYTEMAALLGKPAAVRAMARANGDNTLSIIIPCHRVIGIDGNLTGYGGGLWRKQWLLEHEQRFSRKIFESAGAREARIGAQPHQAIHNAPQ